MQGNFTRRAPTRTLGAAGGLRDDAAEEGEALSPERPRALGGQRVGAGAELLAERVDQVVDHLERRERDLEVGVVEKAGEELAK